MDPTAVLASTQNWISRVVIGLDLCPFASRVFDGGLIRYVVSAAADEESLTSELGDELIRLANTPVSEVETTLLIHPEVLTDFDAFNDFLSLANHLLKAMALEGVIQIASFHPRYQFEGSGPEDVDNYTNRSPHPMLHLLREESLSRVMADGADPLAIPRRNIERLRELGLAAMRAIFESVRTRRLH